MKQITVGDNQEKLNELVERFKYNIEIYKSNQYDESNTRSDFIDKFFVLLGWDVYNDLGASEDFREVVREDKVVIEGRPKSPDYSFKIGRERQFFVEAKKPSVNIHDNKISAFQLRRYAYTADLPISILTNFEEFAIYDTKIKPNENDSSSVARIFYCKYDEYEKNWDFLFNTISKQAVLQGKLKKYSIDNSKKKGTQSIDKELLRLIETWRLDLAKNIAQRNKELDIYQLNEAVQTIIDRIIFLRMAEDRNTEIYGTLQKYASKQNIYEILVKYFDSSNKKYNSGLFTTNIWLNKLIIDDKIFITIINELYYPMPYEFSVLPIEILGQIYEQFLGKTIRLTAGHQAKVEEKPEVRKAGGVYYTPKYIVDYIVENTVGTKIENQTPKDIESLTILDPACGSGSFLVGAYKFLLNYHIEYYTKNGNIKKAIKEGRIYEAGKDDYRLTIREKKNILLNNIYGVDIDFQAVEVTKLSLLLTLMEGEIVESRGEIFLKSMSEALLPNLDNNIKCGNSLIGTDFYHDKDLQLFDRHEQRKINCFDWEVEFPNVFRGKIEKFDNEYFETKLKLGMEKAKEAEKIAGEAYEHTYHAYDYAKKFDLVKENVQNYHSSSSSGFDVVIGNPPYVRSLWLKANDPISWEHYKNSFLLAKEKEFDLYLPFLEKACSLINSNGLIGLIMPNKWLHAQMGEIAREYFLNNRKIKEIVNFKSYQIFENATNYTMIIILSGYENETINVKQYIGPLTYLNDNKVIFDNLEFWENSINNYCYLGKNPWSFISDKKSQIFKNLKNYQPLRKFIKIIQGTGTRADKVFFVKIIEEIGNEFKIYSSLTEKFHWIEKIYIKPSIKGKSIGRYKIIADNFGLIFPYEGKELIKSEIIKNLSPKLWDYLLICKKYLNQRENGRFKGNFWYCYGRPQNHDFLNNYKIIIPAICNQSEAAWDNIGYYPIDSIYLVKIINENYHPFFYLSLLNSKLLTFFLKETGTNLRGGYFTMKTSYLNPFPIKEINFSNKSEKAQHDRMVSLVEQMIDTQKEAHSDKIVTEIDKKLINQRIKLLDKQIDTLVYELYGLTEEEIKIVEESV